MEFYFAQEAVDEVSEQSLTTLSTHNRSFWRRVFSGCNGTDI